LSIEDLVILMTTVIQIKTEKESADNLLRDSRATSNAEKIRILHSAQNKYAKVIRALDPKDSSKFGDRELAESLIGRSICQYYLGDPQGADRDMRRAFCALSVTYKQSIGIETPSSLEYKYHPYVPYLRQVVIHNKKAMDEKLDNRLVYYPAEIFSRTAVLTLESAKQRMKEQDYGSVMKLCAQSSAENPFNPNLYNIWSAAARNMCWAQTSTSEKRKYRDTANALLRIGVGLHLNIEFGNSDGVSKLNQNFANAWMSNGMDSVEY